MKASLWVFSAVELKFTSLWGMTPHHWIVGYPRFKITYWFQLQCPWTFRPLSMRQLRCLETSGTVNTLTRRYIPENGNLPHCFVLRKTFM